MHSHYIIRNAGLPGFDQTETKIMANIARFHRKKLPSKKALKAEGLEEKNKDTVAVLSTFLRFAEKLDRSHTGLVKQVEFVKVSKEQMLLRFYSDSDCSLEQWSILQNRQAFYDAFGKQLEAQCVITTTLPQ